MYRLTLETRGMPYAIGLPGWNCRFVKIWWLKASVGRIDTQSRHMQGIARSITAVSGWWNWLTRHSHCLRGYFPVLSWFIGPYVYAIRKWSLVPYSQEFFNLLFVRGKVAQWGDVAHATVKAIRRYVWPARFSQMEKQQQRGKSIPRDASCHDVKNML